MQKPLKTFYDNTTSSRGMQRVARGTHEIDTYCADVAFRVRVILQARVRMK